LDPVYISTTIYYSTTVVKKFFKYKFANLDFLEGVEMTFSF